MLELVDITKSYESPTGVGAEAVLKGVNLMLEKAVCVAVVGPSGSGKSTLLNIIGGLDQPTSGQVIFDDRDLGVLSDAELARIRNKEIGFVFQLHHLLPQCTVVENVMVPSLANRTGVSKQQVHERAVSLLERVGLKDRMLYRPGELSGGERQRVAVARALINGPKLLLADEPTGSLDEENSHKMAGLLLELNTAEGVALVVVTHSLKLAERIGNVLELSKGVLHERGRA
jgi:ABC-type lipoprotein export system ATPase subunit